MQPEDMNRILSDASQTVLDIAISQEIETAVQLAKASQSMRSYESIVKEELMKKAGQYAFNNNPQATFKALERIAQEVYPEGKPEERICRFFSRGLEETEFFVDLTIRAHQITAEDQAAKYSLRTVSPQKMFESKALLDEPITGSQYLEIININGLFTYGRDYLNISRKEGLKADEKGVLEAYAKIFIDAGIRNAVRNLLQTGKQSKANDDNTERKSLLVDCFYHASLVKDKPAIAHITNLFGRTAFSSAVQKYQIPKKIEYRIVDRILDKKEISDKDSFTLRAYVNQEHQGDGMMDQATVDRLIFAAWSVGEAKKDTNMLYIGKIYVNRYYPESAALRKFENAIVEYRI